jgi:hypothetical protein
VAKASRGNFRKKEIASQVNERANDRVPTSTPLGVIYREEEVVVYIYFIGGIEYYKKIPIIYK